MSDTSASNTGWPTQKEQDARADARAKLVAQSMMRGDDPVDALIEHDQGLAHLPAAERRAAKLNNPNHGERVQGADPRTIATHRTVKAFDTVEVRTTMDFLLKHAEDHNLGKKVLDGCDKILTEFLNNPLPEMSDECARVRPKEFTEVAKILMKFYADSRQFYIQRRSLNEEEETVDLTSAGDVMQRLSEVSARAASIASVLQQAKSVKGDADDA